uniref:DUF2384 domain-containing protein n=1 Tax=Steinernema glaseri TaxID=37863 RepID=A0A1I7Z8J6_9BILA
MARDWFDGLRRAAEGHRLMVLDTLRRFHIEEENASGPMAQGAAMAGAGDQQQASRGSSVLVDNIRWQSYLSGMTLAEAEEWGVDEGQRGFFVRYGARVMIYQPSQRPRERAGQWIDTSFGRCRVTGRLGQRHADIVESMLYVAERRREISDGGIELLIDPAKLRRMLSDHQYSHDRIKKLLTDLRAATVEIVTPEMESTGDSIIGGLIDH